MTTQPSRRLNRSFVWRIAALVTVGACTLALTSGATSAQGVQPESGWAPLDQPGPALEAPIDELDAALTCYAPIEALAADSPDPVLLIPGTTLAAATNYSWNWIPALGAQGIPVCTVELHDRGMADLQRSVENVVHAVATMHERSGRQVRMIGYSQGGLQARFALRFWPELRALVSEVVTLAGVHHGTTAANLLCIPTCAASLHQIRPSSVLVAAINSRALVFDGIDYTSLYSRLDEFATPSNDGTASSVAGAANIALQDVCPTNIAEHLIIGTIDPVAYALAVDALTHPGTADTARIPVDTCSQLTLPGLDLLSAAAELAQLTAELGTTLALHPHVASEPAPRCYLSATCAGPTTTPSPAAAPGSVEVAEPTTQPVLPATGGPLPLTAPLVGLTVALVLLGATRRALRS